MEETNESHEHTFCDCNKIPAMVHELTQSLLIIHSYVNGCSERLKKDDLDSKQLVMSLEKINEQVQRMTHAIRSMA